MIRNALLLSALAGVVSLSACASVGPTTERETAIQNDLGEPMAVVEWSGAEGRILSWTDYQQAHGCWDGNWDLRNEAVWLYDDDRALAIPSEGDPVLREWSAFERRLMASLTAPIAPTPIPQPSDRPEREPRGGDDPATPVPPVESPETEMGAEATGNG